MSTVPDPYPGTPQASGQTIDRMSGQASDHAADQASDQASDRPARRIEAHGIDHIPDAERHGSPRDLFGIWAAANVNYLSLVVGGVLVLIGLSLVQAIAVIVVGNLFWLLTGFLATSGPAAGAPSEVITRALYGVRGNRVNNAVTGWMISVLYFALNLAAAATAAFALVDKAGLPTTDLVKAVVVVLIAATTLTISVYGHGLITRLYLPITLVLAAAFAFVAVAVFRHADFSYAPVEPLTGRDLWATLLAGVTLIAAGPLSYTTSADFSRYLPRDASPGAVMGWTAFGAILPSVIVCSLGALAATAVDMTNPQTGLEGVLPGWFTPVFLLALVLGTVAINALTAYSAGLALQAVGIRIRRSVSVLVDGTVAAALTLYAVLISDFLDTVSDVLQLTVVLLGPSMSIYAVDIMLRRNRYDGLALGDETPGSPFWYTGGVNLSGALALAAGVTAAAVSVDTYYTGPVAEFVGMDLSLPAGVLISAAVYAGLMRNSRTVLAAKEAV